MTPFGQTSVRAITIRRHTDRGPANTAYIARLPSTDMEANVAVRLARELHFGPRWAREVVEEYMNFIKEDLLGTLKEVVEQLETPRPKSESPI